MLDRSGILPFSPLIFSLASVRFAPWPLLAKRVDEIQEELREIAPIIHKVQIQQLSGGPQTLVSDELESISAWVLLSSDRSFGFHLTQDQLLFFSAKYTRYEAFAEQFQLGLTALLRQMRFVDITHIGVRYIDKISASNDESLELYVAPSFFPPAFPGLSAYGGSTVWTYKLGETELRVRGTNQPGKWAFPEDLIGLLAMSQDPTRPLRLAPLSDKEFLLDMDAFVALAHPERMDSQTIMGKLSSLHSLANQYFRSEQICSDHAFSKWKGQEND